MCPLSGYIPLLQFWYFNKGIIIIIIFSENRFSLTVATWQVYAFLVQFLAILWCHHVYMSNAYCAINPIFFFIFSSNWLPKTHKLFFCTGVDRKNVLSLARKYFIYHDYQCVLQDSEKVLILYNARNDSIGDVL